MSEQELVLFNDICKKAMDVLINLRLTLTPSIFHLPSFTLASLSCLAPFVSSMDTLIKVTMMAPRADFPCYPTDTSFSNCPRHVHWYLSVHLSESLDRL